MLLIALIGLRPASASTPAGEREPIGATFARVRFVETVLLHERPGEGEAQQVAANFPVAGGDIVGTSDGRAEIELADSSGVFLDAGTRVEFRSLTDASDADGNVTVLVLESGAMRVDIDAPAILDGRFEIDTAAGAIDLLSAGSFLVEHRDGVTTLCTIHGAAELSGDEGSALLRSGQRSTVRSERSPSEPLRWVAPVADGFDLFHDRRQSEEAGLEADAAVEEETLPDPVRPFAGELASYGTWSTLPEFGRIWRPATTGAWSPYARGYWYWRPVGWVWISSDPWGWAPYHYGRWDYAASQGWYWIPGSVWGGGWVAFAVGPTQVGWCPLDYWNRPVLQERPDSGRMFLSVGLLDARGWQFVPAEQFGARGPERPYLHSDRLPRSMAVAITSTLPPMKRPAMVRPGAAMTWLDQARGSLTALRVPGTPGGQPRSFRSLEPGTTPARTRTRGHPDMGTARHGSAPRPGAPGAPRVPAQPAYAGPEPSPAFGSARDSAVDRLIGGTRPPSAPAPQVRNRQEGTSIAAPRPRPKTTPRPPNPQDDAPKPPPDSQHGQ